MKILSFKVILSSLYSEWVKDEATVTEQDRAVYEDQIRDMYKKVGLTVVDIRLMFGEDCPEQRVPEHEPEVDVNDLPQYKNKPKMMGRKGDAP